MDLPGLDKPCPQDLPGCLPEWTLPGSGTHTSASSTSHRRTSGPGRQGCGLNAHLRSPTSYESADVHGAPFKEGLLLMGLGWGLDLAWDPHPVGWSRGPLGAGKTAPADGVGRG